MGEGTASFRSIAVGAVLAALHLTGVDAAECEQLKKLELPHTEIIVAEGVKAGGFKPPSIEGSGGAPLIAYAHLPSFCRVAGTIRPTAQSEIGFEVWMPDSTGTGAWNGKLVGVGNGAWAGSILHAAMIDPLSMGYATVATDGGHQGSQMDASFGANAEKLADFGHRAIHEMTVAAKAVIDAFYGRKAHRSLFASCSTGGRQGLMEAHRYPDDYDGISSMAPANPVVALMVSSLWTGHATMKDAASRIPREKFSLVHRAAVKACDAGDGVRDGIISAPTRCRFDPAILQCKDGADASRGATDCLTGLQVAALRAIYQGPRNPRTSEPIFPGFEPGSEALLPIPATGTEPFPAVLSYFRDLVFKDPNWDFRSFDFDKDVTRAMQAHSATIDVPAAGLDKYLASGRKLLLTHGWADPLIPPMSTVSFYNELKAHLGEKRAAGARLFMIPGMGHCGGGDGPFVFDAIATIDKWVETGRAPGRIVVSNPSTAPRRARPLCPFPQEAVYIGTGSTDEEKNFRCEAR